MSEKHEFEDDLRQLILDRQVVAFVGSGVSMATNPQAPQWRALIESAVERCQTLRAGDDWCQSVVGLLALPTSDTLLAAADLVQGKLREHGDGEFARWLRNSFESLQPVDSTVIEALEALGTPLVTTNYDDLIEKVTQLRHVTWKDPRNVTRVIRGDDRRDDDRRVLHLHGHWEEPDSVVLGIRSYESVKQNEHTQSAMKAFGMTKSLLFIGCGDEGLADPNFGNFLTWLAAIETDAGVEHRHYRLVRRAEQVAPRGRVFPLIYGDDYSELPAFLRRLCPKPPKTSAGKGKKTARRTRAALPESVAAYLTRLEAETARLKLVGMGKSLQIELPIADAFVPLRTRLVRSLEEDRAERFQEHHAEFEQDVDLGNVFHEAARLGQHGVVLLGEPGSGKTTGARQIAWRLASRQCLPEDMGLPVGITPVLLRFRNLRREALNERNGLRTFLADETRSDAAAKGLDDPGADLDQLSAPRGCGLLWILDGLDEVVDPAARVQVSKWIQQAIAQRPSDRFLVTCRFAGYHRTGVSLGPQFVEFHVRALDEDQIECFVRDWFSAAYKLLNNQPTLAETRSRKLLQVLARPEYQTRKIRELCTNPLMLTILCIVFHDEQQDLPRDRAELYAHCVRVLLQHWRRDLYEPYDGDAAQTVLARLAWWMHGEPNRTAATLDELAVETKLGLADVAASCGLGHDGLAFIQRMKEQTGILASDNDGRCGFLHLSFQEYLAADFAAQEGLAAELAPRLTESWWLEVALLSLRHSRTFCESFFRQMLLAGIAEDRADLADRCLNEAKYFSAAPFLDVLRNSDSPRRIAAVLRLLRDRADQVPDLAAIAAGLADAEDGETRGFAQEISVRLGTIVPPAAGGRQVVVDERTEITFIEIPAGEFDMGAEDSDRENERPVHHVHISRFWLGKYSVTNAQYAQFIEAVGDEVNKPAYWDDRRYNQPEQPVVGVNWDEARAFCEWADCRLPTEAEWEYACRAGTTTAYSFGDDEGLLGEYAWFSENSDQQPQPVGTKRPNGWGLHDMHGNVWEWCQDWYGPYSPDPAADPQGPESGSGRVLRGGSWVNLPRNCRSAIRDDDLPGYRSYVNGFRVART